jgi:putative transposase
MNGCSGRGTARCAPTPARQIGNMIPDSLPTIVRAFKSAVTKGINTLRNTPGAPVWQRNYYEHVITSERDYENIANYIYSNPANWDADAENQNA